MSATGNESLRALGEARPPALDLLRVLAFLAPEPLPGHAVADHADRLPEPLAAAIGDPDRRADTVAALIDASLLKVAGDDWLYDAEVGALVREALSEEELEQWCEVALAVMAAAFSDDCDDHRQWSAAEALLAHVIAVTRHAAELGLASTDAARLLVLAADHLDSRGPGTETRDVAERAVAMAKLSGDEILLGDAHAALGRALSSLGDFRATQRELERAIEIRETADPGSVEGARSRVSLAFALIELGRLDRARNELETALDALDGSDDERATSAETEARKTLGWTFFKQGDPASARRLYERALVLARECHGEEHEAVASVLSGLGVVLDELGERHAAINAHEEAVAIAATALGGDHPEVGIFRSNLSDALLHVGRDDDAREQLELALEIARATLPKDHPGLRIRHRKLAAVAHRAGDLETARRHAERALAIAESGPGFDDSDVIADTFVLAELLVAEGDVDALELYATGLAKTRRALGANHPDTAVQTMIAGRAAHTLGDFHGARERLADALAIFERIDRDDGVHATLCRLTLGRLAEKLGEKLAGTLEAVGQHEHAAAARAAAGESYSALLAAGTEVDDPDSLMMYAKACLERKELRLAERMLTAAGEALAEGAARHEFATGWRALGRFHRDAGSFDAADRAYRAGLSLLDDGEHRHRGVLLHDLGDTLFAAGDAHQAIDLFQQAVEHKRLLGPPASPRDLAASLISRGLLQLATGGREGALEAGVESVQLLRDAEEAPRPMLARALLLAGRAHLAADAPQAAIPEFKEAVELLDTDEDGTLELAAATGLLAAAELATGADRQARSTLDAGLDTRVVGAALAIGDACRESGAFDFAKQALERAEALVVGVAASADGDATVRQVGAAWRKLGRDCAQTDDLAAARHAFRRALPLVAADAQAHGVVLHDLGAIARTEGQLREAAELFRRALARKREADAAPDPRDLGATLHALGRILEQLGELDDALACYEERLALLQSLEKRDTFAECVVLNDLGDVRRAQDRPADAAELYERVLASMDDLPDGPAPEELAVTLLALGATELELGRTEPGRDHAKRALAVVRDLPPDDPGGLLLPPALALAADAELKSGGPRRALELLTEADALMHEHKPDADPDENASVVKELLARAYDALGRDAEAVTAREQAAALTGTRP